MTDPCDTAAMREAASRTQERAAASRQAAERARELITQARAIRARAAAFPRVEEIDKLEAEALRGQPADAARRAEIQNTAGQARLLKEQIDQVDAALADELRRAEAPGTDPA